MQRGSFRSIKLGLMLALALAPATAQPPMPVDGGGPGGGGPAETGAIAAAAATAALSDAQSPSATGAPGGTIGPNATTDAIIQYDAETDSIIVITDEQTNQQIKKVIETLDRPTPQVLIKVLFLEVTHSNDLDLGAEASFAWNEKSDGTFRDTISSDFGVASATEGSFYKILDGDLQATLHALAEVGKTNVLSRPSIMTRNNQTATITVGQEIPFITNSRITDDGQTINTIRYDDIGIILEVTPRITDDRLVQMEVAPEISTLTADTVPISSTVDARVIALRSAETSVVVADGKTVVIGGLMQDNETDSVKKVPLLGDIPGLGMLFRRSQTSKVKTELLIFLTPYVVDSPQQADKLASDEHKKAEVPPKVFTPKQQEKFLDNFDQQNAPWTGKP